MLTILHQHLSTGNATPRLRAVLAVLVVAMFGGCATTTCRDCGYCCPWTNSSATNSSAAGGEGSGSASAPASRTLPEALYRYFCRLHCECVTGQSSSDQPAKDSAASAPAEKGAAASRVPPAPTIVAPTPTPPPAPAAELTRAESSRADLSRAEPSAQLQQAAAIASFDPFDDALRSEGAAEPLTTISAQYPSAASQTQPAKPNDATSGKADASTKSDPSKQQSSELPKSGDSASAPAESPIGLPKIQTPPWLSAHAQTTVIDQIHDHFQAPYTGPNSLLRVEPSALSETATLFLDARIIEGGELVFNPEVAGGRGFSDVTGVAGFPNGEIPRVGKPQPTPYVGRLFWRQTWGLGGEKETVEDGPNQLAGSRDIDRITVSAGKMAFTDFMDNNRYSHDPRSQMMNWSIMYNSAWDYPADVRGYNYGLAVDFNHKDWALRYGIFGEPDVANGSSIDDHVLKANGQALELEERWSMNGHPGAIRTMGYLNLAHMGNYRDAVEASPVDPSVVSTRAWRIKYGFGANLEQEITKDLGFWARIGWNDGHTESWAFTAVDDTLSLGVLLKGTRWHRPDDQVGLGCAFNGLSGSHREYLAAGGLDFIIGDGQLNYAPEEIFETYYSLKLAQGIYWTGDFQFINNPAYNEDRGPVVVASFRFHMEL